MKYSYSVLSFLNLLYILCSYIGSVKGIRGGNYADVGQFMYHVSVLINGQAACGGSILDDRHVLSAAQCVLGEDGLFLNVRFDILAGVNYLDSNSFSKVKRKVKYIHILYDFRPPGRTPQLYPSSLEVGDIAVLELDENLPLGSNSALKFTALPARIQCKHRKFNDKEVNVTGFGQDNPTNYQSASDLSNLLLRRNSYKRLKYIQNSVQRKDICKRSYPAFKDSHLCAMSLDRLYDSPTGACIGDVGGPLVTDDYRVIGVLSIYGDGCDQTEQPALYTRVSSFRHFILSAVRGEFHNYMRLANYTGPYVDEIIHSERLN